MVKSADGVIVSEVKDVDDFSEHERTFLLEHNRVKDTSPKSDRMTRFHKNAADDYNRIGTSLYALETQDSTDICKFFLKFQNCLIKQEKYSIEARMSADEDFKLSDL